MKATTLAELHSLAATMAANPADAVQKAGLLLEMVRALPPDRGEILSRQVFELGSLWTLGSSFESLPVDGTEAPAQEVRMQGDVWIRGVTAVAIPTLASTDYNTIEFLASLLRFFEQVNGDNGRIFLEGNWRLDGKQGFISTGAQGEILAPVPLICGNGEWSAPLDWKLQKDQTIEVRLRSSWLENGFASFGPEFAVPIRWAVVTFWGEEMAAPSVATNALVL